MVAGPAFSSSGWCRLLLVGHWELPKGLSFTARCDYYCASYLVHPRCPAGQVPHHPPPNLSVRQSVFLRTSGYTEQGPLAYSNEERKWQAELRQMGHTIYFEPKAIVYHYNRSGFVNLLRRNYRWAYTAIESKSTTGSARLSWMYQYPRLFLVVSLPLVFAHTLYIISCWMRVGIFEPRSDASRWFLHRGWPTLREWLSGESNGSGVEVEFQPFSTLTKNGSHKMEDNLV